MYKKWTKSLIALLLMFIMAIGQSVTGFADDGDASIVVSGDGVYEVEAGVTTKLDLQVKNKGTGTAERVQLEPRVVSALSPFRVKIQGGGNIGTLSAGEFEKVTLTVTVDGNVEEPSYELPIEYTYHTRSGSVNTGTMTVYLKMKGYDREPGFQLQDMKLSPETMSPGSSAELSGAVVNTGGQDMYQLEVSLDNLTTEGISLTGGFNSKMISRLSMNDRFVFRFPLVAAADMAAGNYPVSIKLKYEDEFGKEYEKTQQYYINIGGVAGRKADLVIRNMREPGGTYGVNQNFTVSFDLHNEGKVTAKDIVITAAPVDSSAVVPKSASMKTVDELAPGASSRQSFTFAGTSKSSSQNYAIEFTVEYTSGGTAVTTFRQFAGVNVSNPDSDEENTSKPKIIVSDYECDPLIVMAGEEFDLNLTLLNTHKAKSVSNIKMFLTLAEETSSDSEKSGNIFTPVNSSNTFYFDSIRPKGTVEKSLRLYVVPDAQPKTYTLTVNFEYEDSSGNEYIATELLGINVKQVTDLQIDEFSVPDMVEQYQPVSIAFSYYNTGKVDLSNLMIRVEGDVECDSRNTFIGNLEQGDSDYYETTFTPGTIGEVPVTIIISYEDPSGETIEERRELILNVTEPYVPDEMLPEEEEPSMSMGKAVAGLLVMAVLAALLVLFVKKQKEPPRSSGNSVSAAEEDDEEDGYVDQEVIVTKDEEGMSL